jgi:hypothetical protein
LALGQYTFLQVAVGHGRKGTIMGELLDRGFQRQLLMELRDVYPHKIDVLQHWGSQSDNRLLVNLSYLAEHGLIEFSTRTLVSREIFMGFAKITAVGMDFVADDGGLSAILGVVTVKLHENTVRDLLVANVTASDTPTSTKEQLIAKIKGLPTDALGSLTEKALDAGLASIPNLGAWLLSAIDAGRERGI